MGLIEVRVGARGGAFVTAPTGSKVAQAMSDMMMMAVDHARRTSSRRGSIVELGTVTLAVRARDRRGPRAAARARRARARRARGGHVHARDLVGVPLAARAGRAQRRRRRADAVVPQHALDAPVRAPRGRQGARGDRRGARTASSTRSSDATRTPRGTRWRDHLLRGTNLERSRPRCSTGGAPSKFVAARLEPARQVVPRLLRGAAAASSSSRFASASSSLDHVSARRRRSRGCSCGRRARAAPRSSRAVDDVARRT